MEAVSTALIRAVKTGVHLSHDIFQVLVNVETFYIDHYMEKWQKSM